ncbi:MAG: hypothetical protein AAGE98_08400 [Actinomycetota bacterium]
MSKRVLVAVSSMVVLTVGLGAFVVFGLGVGDETLERVVDEVMPGDDDGETAAPTTTRPVYVEPSPRPVLPDVQPSGVRFSCDFTVACPLDQFVQFRDGFVVRVEDGRADHAVAPDATLDNPICTPPEETRAWARTEPYGLTYRCLPGGNADAAHQMSVAPDTTGYSFTGSSPDLVFESVERISFSVNMTSAGSRNFWEVAIIPADQSWVDAMPCIPDLPCNDAYDYDDIGAVGFGNQSNEGSGFQIATPDSPDGVYFDLHETVALDDGGVRYLPCEGDDFCFRTRVHEGQPDVRSRYAVEIEQRDDGIWFGQEAADGSMHWVALDGGTFPDGPVRVVLKFHGYTPTKDGTGPGYDANLSASEGAFTWHWDDFEVVAGAAVSSVDYYGDLNPERFTTASAPACLAFAQGQRDEANRTVFPLLSCPADVELDGARSGPIEALTATG